MLEEFSNPSVYSAKHFLVGRIVFFMWTAAKDQFGFKFFDLDQLKTVSNDNLTKLGGLISNAFDSVGMKDSKYSFNEYSIVYRR